MTDKDREGGGGSGQGKPLSTGSDLDFSITPEIPSPTPSGENPYEKIPPGADLEEATLKKLDHENLRLKRELEEQAQLHDLRTSHAKRLFFLTVVWIFVIWVMLLLQGFGQWFFPIPDSFKGWVYIPFNLSDSVMIAFMTSTTATVLGLYGVAAYWLYGKPKDQKVEAKKAKK